MLQLTEEEIFAIWIRENTRGIQFGPSRVLVTRDLQEAKSFSDQGGTVLFVAKEVKEYGRFSRACGTGHSIFKLYERSTLTHWHSFLWAGDPEGQEPYSDIPKEPAGPYRIVVRSTKQAGGTWFSWNLLETLTQQGVSVSWQSIAPHNPLPIWLQRADPRVQLQGLHEEVQKVAVQIIDATDSDEIVEGDFVVVVTDGDPAKSVPEGGNDYVLNRHPSGLAMYPDAIDAIRRGQALVLTHPELEAWMWDWYRRIRRIEEIKPFIHLSESLPQGRSLKQNKTQEEEHLADSLKELSKNEEQTFDFFRSSPTTESLGFDFTDEEKGFDFDA